MTNSSNMIPVIERNICGGIREIITSQDVDVKVQVRSRLRTHVNPCTYTLTLTLRNMHFRKDHHKNYGI